MAPNGFIKKHFTIEYYLSGISYTASRKLIVKVIFVKNIENKNNVIFVKNIYMK